MGAKTRLTYHIILTTKYRKPVLFGIEQQVYQALRDVEAKLSFRIVEMGIEDGNHIHLVVESSPYYSVSGIVNRVKGFSLKYLWAENGSTYRASIGGRRGCGMAYISLRLWGRFPRILFWIT